MLTAPDFPLVYKAQDLYFFDPRARCSSPTRCSCRRASPTSTGEQPGQRARSRPHRRRGCKARPTPSPRHDAFPPSPFGVTVDGPTATVNLGGAAAQRQRGSSGAVLRAAGLDADRAAAGSPPSIQSVQLEINGKPWTPQPRPAQGPRQGQSPSRSWPCTSALTRIRRRRPASTTSTTGRPGHDAARSHRCGRHHRPGRAGLQPDRARSAQPVLRRPGARPCPRPSPPASAQRRARLVHGGGVARRQVPGRRVRARMPCTCGPSGAASPPAALPASGITAISWDRQRQPLGGRERRHLMVLPTSSGVQLPRDLQRLRPGDHRPERRPRRGPGRRHRADRLG